MEYQHPDVKVKPYNTCTVIYGKHLVFVVAPMPRKERVVLCTANLWVLLAFLQTFRFYITNIEYLFDIGECPIPDYGK